MLLNGRIISGIIAIILQIIACLTFVVFGIGFLLWLILAIWAVNSRSKAKTERRLREMEKKIANPNTQKQFVQEPTTTVKEETPKPIPVDKIEKTVEPKPELNKEETIKEPIKLKPILFTVSAIVLIGLGYFIYSRFFTIDFSDPLKVLKATEKQWRENDLKTYYKYLTEKSQQTYKSYDDFVKIKTIPDSVLKTYQTISIDYEEIPVTNSENYRKFKITAKAIEKKDTVTNEYYRTLYNENGNWKLTWNKELVKEASLIYQQGDFSKAAKLFNSAINIDPFSITARTQLVWCYIRDAERPKYWQDTSVYHLNFLLELDSTDSDIYNAVGAYYSNINENKKAVNNFLLAAKYSKDSSAIANYYSNAAQNAKSYNVSKAETYLDKSLEYNQNSLFAWQTFGDLLYNNQKYSNAKDKYSKAIELVSIDKNIDNHTLINLYGYYALTCKKLGLKDEAEEYILKCIRVYPDKKHPIFKELNL